MNLFDATMNIEVLFEKPDLETKASLFIEPLAPLSLVTSMPGAYYRSQREPSAFMIYGMLENLLGWHFDTKVRNSITKKVKAHHKKKHKDTSLVFGSTPVGYCPLLQYHLKIEKIFLVPHIESYDDYWTQHLKDVDTSLKSQSSHPKGSRNYDFQLDEIINNIYRLPKNERDKEWQKVYNKYVNIFPMYYQSPTKREFIKVKGEYGFPIMTTESVLELLIDAISQLNAPLYLGTNEGWINLKIIRI